MRYTLKDYQSEAVRDVLRNLDQARDMYHRYGSKTQFSLTATTGAGKTVMAAAVIEALFFGNDEFDFEADPGQRVDDLVERRVCVEVLLEPAKGELHAPTPPDRVGTSRLEKP